MPEVSDRNLDFLVSFKESDRAWAEHIGQMLHEAGYEVELLSWAYKASRDMLKEVQRRGTTGAVFLPILTPAYMTTLHAEHYWFEAFREGYFPVLPVLARECDISSLLFVHEYIDIRDSTVDEARARIVGSAYRLKPTPANPRRHAVPAESTIMHGVKMSELAPVRRVPFERADPFIGGEALLNGLHAALSQDHIAALMPHIGGIDGYGRSKTCVEYLYRFERDYRLIWVVRADRPAILADDYARLAEVVKLPEEGSRDLPYTVQAVRRWLSANPGWLLIFHNPPNYAAIAPYLPELAKGHVLISASKGDWQDAKSVFHLATWTEEQTRQYLSHLLHTEAAVADELGQCLHHYPIAMGIAARTAQEFGWPPPALLQHLVARQSALAPALKGANPQRVALATAISLALSELWRIAPDAVDLLRAIAYLDPHNILPGILVSGADSLPGELGRALKDHRRTEEMIQRLKRTSLIEERFGSIKVHPLIQAQMREWMEAPPRSEIHTVHPQFSQARSFSLARAEGPLWARRMLRLMLSIFPTRPELEHRWRQSSKVIAHLGTVLEHATRLGLERADCVELWTRRGEYLLFREMLEPAAEALERASELDAQPHIGGSEQRYHLLRALGQVRSFQGQHDVAREHLEQGLRAAERAHGRKSSAVSELLIMLGNACRHQGDNAAALAAFEEALEIDRQLHGGQHPDLVRDLMLVGTAKHDAGDLSAAWGLFEQALGMQGIVHGPTHISLAQVSKCLARVYAAMGDFPQSQKYYRQAIGVAAQLHGPGHPALAEVYREYGNVQLELRDIEAARKAFKEEFKILEANHGSNAPSLMECALRLGDTATAKGDPKKALSAYERAVHIARSNQDSSESAKRAYQRLTTAREALAKLTQVPQE